MRWTLPLAVCLSLAGGEIARAERTPTRTRARAKGKAKKPKKASPEQVDSAPRTDSVTSSLGRTPKAGLKELRIPGGRELRGGPALEIAQPGENWNPVDQQRIPEAARITPRRPSQAVVRSLTRDLERFGTGPDLPLTPERLVALARVGRYPATLGQRTSRVGFLDDAATSPMPLHPQQYAFYRWTISQQEDYTGGPSSILRLASFGFDRGKTLAGGTVVIQAHTDYKAKFYNHVPSVALVSPKTGKILVDLPGTLTWAGKSEFITYGAGMIRKFGQDGSQIWAHKVYANKKFPKILKSRSLPDGTFTFTVKAVGGGDSNDVYTITAGGEIFDIK